MTLLGYTIVCTETVLPNGPQRHVGGYEIYSTPEAAEYERKRMQGHADLDADIDKDVQRTFWVGEVHGLAERPPGQMLERCESCGALEDEPHTWNCPSRGVTAP